MEALCSDLADELRTADGRGFVLVRVAGGYRFAEPSRAGRTTSSSFVLDGQSSRLSSAALETLAIVAYKQPLSRAQISASAAWTPTE